MGSKTTIKMWLWFGMSVVDAIRSEIQKTAWACTGPHPDIRQRAEQAPTHRFTVHDRWQERWRGGGGGGVLKRVSCKKSLPVRPSKKTTWELGQSVKMQKKIRNTDYPHNNNYDHDNHYDQPPWPPPTTATTKTITTTRTTRTVTTINTDTTVITITACILYNV